MTAIAGLGLSRYSRATAGRSIGSRCIEACLRALEDAGLAPSEVDGICGSTVATQFIQAAIGIESVTWLANVAAPIGNQLVAAVNAVHAGMCDVVLAYHGTYRTPRQSRSAADDPFRRRAELATGDHRSWLGTGHVDAEPLAISGPTAYAAWASRYLHDHSCSRERLGLIAVNGRSHAAENENAVLRDRLTLAGYLQGRMVRDPLCVFDMDVPVDGADAFVVTSARRARDGPRPSVLIHAATLGQARYGAEDQLATLEDSSQAVVARSLWARSLLTLADIDVCLPYDGFSITAVKWLESVGYCGHGEAGDFLAEQWDEASQRIVIDGRVGVNTHGGSLSEGATQGAGHLREAVHQLRGDAGARQVLGAEAALVVLGGFFFNAQGIILRADR